MRKLLHVCERFNLTASAHELLNAYETSQRAKRGAAPAVAEFAARAAVPPIEVPRLLQPEKHRYASQRIRSTGRLRFVALPIVSLVGADENSRDLSELVASPFLYFQA